MTVNPNPQIVQIPVRIHATDTVDRLVEKIKKNLSLTAYNKELFDITIEKADSAVQITVVAKKPTKLTMNVFGILADQKPMVLLPLNIRSYPVSWLMLLLVMKTFVIL